MLIIGNISFEKKTYAIQLLRQGLTYREIQDVLKEKFGNGMSNTSLQNLKTKVNEFQRIKQENVDLRKELAMYKNLYFQLLDAMKQKYDPKDEEI